ncbi:MAG: NADPH:quinone oxidoreductase family protein [Pseudomonadota bacterium]
MRAFRIDSADCRPRLTETDRLDPGSDELEIRISACGLNFADLLMIKGTYQDTPELPFTLGMEVAGTVERVGTQVTGFAEGDRIAVFGGQGGLAEYGCFSVDRAVKLPESMPFEDAAAFQIAYGTSHVALDHKARLKKGETLLVLGAAGGVGLTAIEIGKLMGATVVACARGSEKLEIAKAAGADRLIDAKTDDIREVCQSLGGLDVVYDPVGGDQFKSAFRACKPEARILTIGFASGEVPKIPANHLLVKNIDVMGLYWGGYLAFRPQVITQSLATLVKWYEARRISPHIGAIYPFEQAQDGLDLLASRKSTGKVVIKID